MPFVNQRKCFLCGELVAYDHQCDLTYRDLNLAEMGPDAKTVLLGDWAEYWTRTHPEG